MKIKNQSIPKAGIKPCLCTPFAPLTYIHHGLRLSSTVWFGKTLHNQSISNYPSYFVAFPSISFHPLLPTLPLLVLHCSRFFHFPPVISLTLCALFMCCLLIARSWVASLKADISTHCTHSGIKYQPCPCPCTLLLPFLPLPSHFFILPLFALGRRCTINESVSYFANSSSSCTACILTNA